MNIWLSAQATLHKPAWLTIRGVFKTMRQIAAEKGSGSAARKQRAVLSLLRSARCGFVTAPIVLNALQLVSPFEAALDE